MPLPANFEKLCGHRYDWREVDEYVSSQRRPIFGVAGAPLADSGKGKIVLLHKAVEQVAGRFPVHLQTVGDCFVSGTMVLGRSIKPIDEVGVGEEIWTAEGKRATVISRREIITNKPLVRIQPVGMLPITCTADHKLLVYRMRRVAGKRVNPAYYNRVMGVAKDPQKCAVVKSYESRRAEWVSAGDLRDTDCLLTPTCFDAVPRPESFGLLETEGGMFLAGYFLGDGHASGGTVEFAVANTEIAEKISGILVSAGFNPKQEPYRKNCGAWRVRVHAKALVEWFRQHFYSGKSKAFPGWAVGNGAFIAGLHAADGHVIGEQLAIDSTSRSIIYGAYATLVAIGYEPTIGQVARSEGSFANAKPIYRLIWRNNKQKSYVWRDHNYVCRPVRRIEFLEGPMAVFDIGVDDPHHSFIANGVAAHNCVSHGFGLCVDVVKCVEIAAGEPEEWEAETATEFIYWYSRVEIGKGQLGNSDGSVGAWAARAVKEGGTLVRKAYGKYDLTEYSGAMARKYGARGTGAPDELEPTAREHPILTASLVRSYEEARDAIANGYPVAVCSNQGFSAKRDAEGFAKASGSWAHCMAFVAVDDEYKRPGLLCQNSWGETWITGPKRHGQPEGSFWVDASVANKMLSRNADSYALSGYVGFPKRDATEWI